jgi:tetratricopeptide (TPR) repeat protein
MKAEHRHELKTNALADMLGRTWRTIKTGPSRHGLLLAGIAIAIVVVAATAYFVWKSHREARSALWFKVDDVQRKLDEATDAGDVKKALDDAKNLAEKNPGTAQARGLRYERARTLLRQGLGRLGSAPDRDEAKENIKEARKLFADLAAEPAGKDNDPILTQEALMSVAVADESLGDLKEAIKDYKKVAETYQGSAVAKAAHDRINALESPDSLKEATDVHDKLNLPPLKDNTK